MIHYKCACGKSYQSDDLAAGDRVRCPACGAMLTVPEPDDVSSGPPGGEVPLTPGCPICQEPFKDGQVVCTACGYDTVTERKMTTDLREEAPQVAEPAQQRPSRLPLIGLVAAALVVVLLIVAITWRIGDDAPVSMDAQKQIIRDTVSLELDGSGYHAGEFTECVDRGRHIRYAIPVLDAGGLEVGRATGTLGRDGNPPAAPSVDIAFD